MTVAILVPVLNRPHRVAALLESIEAATPEPHQVLFIANVGDDAQIDAVEAAGADLLVVDQVAYVHKINAGFAATAAPVVMHAADDLHFHRGWLPAALEVLDRPGIEVVGTNDLANPRVMAGRHSCHNVFTRSYIDERGGTIDGPGLVMHAGYRHWYCDDELVQTSRQRCVWAFAEYSHVEHLHPIFGKAAEDDTYRLGRLHNAEDRARYRRRRHLWEQAA